MKPKFGFEYPIHGTYPLDGGEWEIVRPPGSTEGNGELAREEVGDLLGLDPTTFPLGRGGAWGTWQGPYLWLNKGFVLCGGPEGVVPGGALALMEVLGGSPQVKGIEQGRRAVYLGDGTYYLIERK